MKNIAAIADMEAFATLVLKLSPENQAKYWEALKENGLSTQDIEALQKSVGIYKLMTNQRFYKAAQNAIGETLWAEFRA